MPLEEMRQQLASKPPRYRESHDCRCEQARPKGEDRAEAETQINTSYLFRALTLPHALSVNEVCAE